MRLHARAKQLTATFAVLGLLSACGGGGDDGGASPALPAGAYEGEVNSNGTALRVLLLDNNEVWALYGVESGSALLANSFVQGSGTANAFVYTTTNAKDFGYAPPLPVKITASYTASGIFRGDLDGATFEGHRMSSTAYNYTKKAEVSDLVGTWSSDYNDTVNTVEVKSDGEVIGSTTPDGAPACAFTGKVTPHSSEKNVFRVEIKFGALPNCSAAVAGKNMTGVAYASAIGGGQRQLLVGVVDDIANTRNVGAALTVFK